MTTSIGYPMWVTSLLWICTILFFITAYLIIMMKTKIPELFTLLKASTFGKPLVYIHDSFKQVKISVPVIEGKKHDGNMYELKNMGVKFIPNPSLVEHMDSRTIIQYYSKAPNALSAKIAAACGECANAIRKKGLEVNESTVDLLFIASDDEIREICSKTNESGKIVVFDGYKEIMSLRKELKKTVIPDSQFIYQTVQDFVFAAQALTARGLDEAVGIANERAVDAVKFKDTRDYMALIMMFTFLIIGAAIAYTIINSSKISPM